MTPRDRLPKRHPSHILCAAAELAFAQALEGSDFFSQSGGRDDYGTDYQIEVAPDGNTTNVRVHVQLKGTDQDANKDGSVSIVVAQANLNYLLHQPYAIYVCYHRPTKRLLMRSAYSVVRQYERAGGEWTDQETLTVKFKDEITPERLKALAALSLADGVAMREWRYGYMSSGPSAMPALLRRRADIHVPPDPADASELLTTMFTEGMDQAISVAADRFEAVLGADSQAMMHVHLAEINLVTTGGRPDRERVRRAIAFLSQAHERAHQDLGNLRYCLANGHLALGEHDIAKHWYLSALDVLDSTDDRELLGRCLKNLGTSEGHLGDEAAAASRYRQALDVYPGLAEAHFALGQMEHRRGHFSEALEHYDDIVFDKGDPDRYLAVPGWRINALFNIDDGRAAFRDINALIGDAGRADWIWHACARQVARFGRKNTENARFATLIWRRFLGAFPGDSDGTRELLLAKLFVRATSGDIGTDYAGFRAQFDQGIALVHGEAAALLWDRMGHWAQENEDWSEAELCFRHAYELEGGHFGYCLGTTLTFLGRFEEALPLLQAQADGLQPDATSFNQLGHVLERLSRLDEAAAAYREAIRLDEECELAWFNLGGLLWNRKDFSEGLAIWSEAVRRFPAHPLTARLHEDLPQLFSGEPRS
ncbi:tetratricopeptide repeat protein [Luteibacter sp.]|uniref:tetratricopeptide repeat protein n=1 Tax=Luteibacter sp. TaxID=1886636 RepID=UPI003F80A1F4